MKHLMDGLKLVADGHKLIADGIVEFIGEWEDKVKLDAANPRDGKSLDKMIEYLKSIYTIDELESELGVGKRTIDRWFKRECKPTSDHEQRLSELVAKGKHELNNVIKPAFSDKVRRICRKLGAGKPGTGKAARLIGVDPSTIIDWRKRLDDWNPAHKRLELKVTALYNELFPA